MERAIRYSQKRADILAAIQGTDCHPSAEWVYQQLKPSHPGLSLGTVYRNLIFFRQQGLIQSVTGAVRRHADPPQPLRLRLLRFRAGPARHPSGRGPGPDRQPAIRPVRAAA